jgi:uncharacterized protein YwqG
MAQCYNCGGSISFKKIDGKWHPRNADGSEHWDVCKRMQREGQPIQQKPALYTQSKHTHFWIENQDIPPWDESLGEFRDFTEEEKREGKICQRQVCMPVLS